MKRVLMIAIAILIAAFVITGEDPIAKFYAKDAPALTYDVQVKPIEHDPIQLLDRPWPGKYRCSVLVEADPGSRIAVATEDIIISPGETKESHSEQGGLSLTFVVELGADAAFAKTSVTLTRDEKVIGRQIATIWLAQPKGAIVPAQLAP